MRQTIMYSKLDHSDITLMLDASRFFIDETVNPSSYHTRLVYLSPMAKGIKS